MSAWPAVLCYAGAIALRLTSRDGERRHAMRALWTSGWILLLAHLVFALVRFHHGSWSAAYEHTASRTQEAVGWNWGGGVWLNLLTALMWGGDVASLWIRRAPDTRFGWPDFVTQGYIGFMMFNATVVFGSRPAQVVGGLICVGLVVLWVRGARGSRAIPDSQVKT